MRLLEMFGIAPSLRGFAMRILRALPPGEREGWTFNPERALLQRQGSSQLALQNMFMEYRAAGFLARGALIRKYADVAGAHASEIPKFWPAAVGHVYPVVRSEFAESTILAQLRAEGGTLDPVALPLAGDLQVRLAYDFGSFVQYAKGEHLRAWGKSAADVLEHAIANLGRLETPTWHDLGGGVWRLTSDVSYAESMLLLPNVVAQLPFAARAVFMPCNRGILLAADGASDEAVVAMLEAADRCFDEEPWPMSGAMLAHVGAGWALVPPPQGASALAWSLGIKHLAQIHAAQKQTLDALHAASGRDVHVAEYSVLAGEDGWQSYCVWAEGVESLLPVTEWVAVLREGEETDFLRVPWQDLVRACGDRMQATPDSPPRFHVASFPDADAWHALSRVALAD